MKNSRYIVSAALAAAALLGTTAQAASYQFRVTSLGIRAEPIVLPAAGELAPYDSPDFGEVRVGQVLSRDFQFKNTGDAPATGVLAVVNRSDLTISASTCGFAGSPVVIEGHQPCDVSVTYHPAQSGTLDGLLSIQGNFLRAPASLALTGSAVQEAIGTLTADVNADFGVVPLNATPATRKFTFRNSGNLAATGVSAAVTTAPGLTLGANSCGTAAAPVSIPGGGSCQVTVSYGGNVSSKLSGAAVKVAGAFTGSPSTVPLAGSLGAFDVAAGWSSHYTNNVALTPAQLTFGTVVRGGQADRTYFLRNLGANGSLSAGFALSGDSSQFRIVDVRQQTSGGSSSCGPTIAPDGQSATPCVWGGPGANVYVVVRYAPTVIGNHSITINPTTGNGSALPAPIVVTGSGQFNPTAAWSTWAHGYAAVWDGYGNYSTAVGGVSDKQFTLANVGTHGGLSVGVVMTGDTSHFTITSVGRSTTEGNYGCGGGGAIVAGGLSTTYCGADSAGTGAPNVTVWIRYTPKAKGNHTVTLTPITNNGSVLPAPLVLKGSGT